MGVTVPTEKSSNLARFVAVVHTRVVLPFLSFEFSWVAVTYEAGMTLILPRLIVRLFGYTIDFLET